MKIHLFIVSALLFASCQVKPKEDNSLSNAEMLSIVQKLGNQFSIGIKNKDSTLLVNIYSDSARYVQPNREILVGKTEIGADWAGFLRIKENPIDLVLIVNNVGGNRETIYETGQGYTLLQDSSKWYFNYVNVWCLKPDGNYNLEVDTYTPLDNGIK